MNTYSSPRVKPRSLLLGLCLLFATTPGKAQSLSETDYVLVKRFITHLKKKRPDSMASDMTFPFRRIYPIPYVMDSAEFVKRFDEIFDNELINTLKQSNIRKDWSRVGYRGIMFNSGAVWLDETGGLLAVNTTTKREADLREARIRSEKAGLHPSLRDYLQPMCIVETKEFRIRIDELQNHRLRLALWNMNDPVDSQPDLVLYDGENTPDGNSGDHVYRFKNGEHRYEILVFGSRENSDFTAMLTIYKGDTEVTVQPATYQGR